MRSRWKKNRCQIHALSVRQISEVEHLMYTEVCFFYFYFQQADPALCSGVGFDPFCCSHMLFIIVLTDSFEPFLRLEIAPFTRTPTSRRINIGVIKDRAVNLKMLLHSLNSTPQRWPALSAPLNQGRKGQVLDDWILWNVTCLRVNTHCCGRIPVSPFAVSVSATPALREEVAPRGLMFNKPPDHSGLAEATARGDASKI